MKQVLLFFLVIILSIETSIAQEEIRSDSISIKTNPQDTSDVSKDKFSLGNLKEFDVKFKRFRKVYWDSYLRARHELWNNQETLNDDIDDLYSFMRIKLQLGGGIKPSDNISIYARFITEARFYGHKGSLDSTINDYFQGRERGNLELLVGQLNFEWRNLLNDRLDFKIGRQTLHDQGFGDQWLIGDGTPMDGSKTFYYNSLRFTYRLNANSSLDLVALSNKAEDSFTIYTDNDNTPTNITDEQGAWLWYKNKKNDRFPYDFYYLYKHENGGGEHHRLLESHIHTAGFHIKPESERFWFDVQMAGQLGDFGEVQRRGFGTIAYAGIQFKNDKSSFRFGPWYMYLSGDDPNTEEFEAFNNLFGGYPNDDELYINTWARESGTSMWTNISLPGLYLEYHPTKKYNIRAWYHYMMANENVPGAFFGSGKFRGQMFMLKAMAMFNDRFMAYYMFEYLIPGDFYFDRADNALLNRINLEWYF